MPDPKPKIALVPARYVGHQPVKLRPGVRYRDAAGQPRPSLILNPGDTLLVPETELRGQTYLVDPSGLSSEAQWLGVGDVLLDEHRAAGLTRADLIGVPFVQDGRVRQYEFHDGRADFQEVDAPWPPKPAAPDAADAGTGAGSAASVPAKSRRSASPASSDASSSSDAPADAAPASDAAQGE